MKGVEGLPLNRLNERKLHRSAARLICSWTFTRDWEFTRFPEPVFSTLRENTLAELLEKGYPGTPRTTLHRCSFRKQSNVTASTRRILPDSPWLASRRACGPPEGTSLLHLAALRMFLGAEDAGIKKALCYLIPQALEILVTYVLSSLKKKRKCSLLFLGNIRLLIRIKGHCQKGKKQVKIQCNHRYLKGDYMLSCPISQERFLYLAYGTTGEISTCSLELPRGLSWTLLSL